MNRHFEDTLYYLKRAGKTAKQGVSEEVQPVETKVRELTGRTEEPEPGRLEKVRAGLRELRAKAEREVEHVSRNARKTIGR